MQPLQKYYLQIFVSSDNSKCYKHWVSLASNNKFTQVFQTIVSVLHSLHHLICGIYIAIGRNFASARTSCSLSMSNCPDTCDSLHVTNLASDVVSIVAILLSRY